VIRPARKLQLINDCCFRDRFIIQEEHGMIENYLTFTIDDSVYAINVSSVLEVLNLTEPTAVPCALPYIEGLIYSRGQGITVINLRKRFALPAHPADKWTKIIVVELNTPSTLDPTHITLYGLVADSVQDVIQLSEEIEIKDAKSSIPKEFVSHVVQYNNSPLFILNFNKLFEESKTVNLEEAVESL